MTRRILARLLPLALAFVISMPATAEGLKIGFREDAPPFSSLSEDPSNESVGAPFTGLSVDLCRVIVTAMPGDVGLQEFGFVASDRFTDTMPPFDLICDPTSITAERFTHCNFSFPYFVTGITFVTEGTPPPLADMAQATIGLVGGTTAEARLEAEWIKEFGTTPSMLDFETYADGIDALEAGRVSALFGDEILLRGATEDGSDLMISGDVLSVELYAICVDPDRPDLLGQVNATLAELYGSGEIYGMLGRHFEGRGASRLLATLYSIYAVPIE